MPKASCARSCRPRSRPSSTGRGFPWSPAASLSPRCASDTATCEGVPLLHLLAHPDSCDGQLVRVTGYLTYGYHDSTIWLSREDAKYGRLDNSLWLKFSKGEYEIRPPSKKRKSLFSISGKYVFVLGRVDRSIHGHQGAYAGAIKVEEVLLMKKSR